MNKTLSLVFILVVVLSGNTYAKWQPQNNDTVTIKAVVTEGNGENSRIYIATDPKLNFELKSDTDSEEDPESKPIECNFDASLIRLSPKSTTSESHTLLYQQLYSAAMTAYASGKPVKLNISEEKCDDWDRPWATAIWNQ